MCFGFLSKLFEISPVTHGKSNSGGPVNSGLSPPGVLVDQISAKFTQLDSGEFGAVGTPAFNAKMHELAVSFARMSQLCQRLGLPVPAHLHRPPFFKH